MKKILTILGALGLTATAALSVVACGKESKQFAEFMTYVNETKGSYDESGIAETKSSASVVYFGARDNASSLSFEYALSQTFGDLTSARTALSHETNILKTQTQEFSGITITDNSFSLSTTDFAPFQDSTILKVKIGAETYDASFLTSPDPDYKITLEQGFSPDSNPMPNVNLKLTGYQTDTPTPQTDRADVIASWNNAYTSWLEQQNADRAIQDLDLNLDVDSKEFGKVSKKKETPVYGIKHNSQTGTITTAYDYAKIKFSLRTMLVDKVSDYWNNDLFKSIINDYLKKDLMYQLTANDDPEIGKGDGYLGRQNTVTDSISKIKEAKGPLFFVIKNGHVIKIMKGWNRYNQFSQGNTGTPSEPADIYQQDLSSWANEIATIFSHSFQDNNPGLFDNGSDLSVKTWEFAKTDDNGAANWDAEKQKPTD